MCRTHPQAAARNRGTGKSHFHGAPEFRVPSSDPSSDGKLIGVCRSGVKQ